MNGPHPAALVLRLLQATPEEQAAVSRFLGSRPPAATVSGTAPQMVVVGSGRVVRGVTVELGDKCDPPLSLGGKTESLAAVAAGSAVKDPKSEIGGRTLEGPDMPAELVRAPRLERQLPLGLQTEVKTVAGGNAEVEAGGPKIVREERILTVGRVQYREGWGLVWVGDERYDLRQRRPARLCLEFLMMKGAFGESSARHFVEEIDPYVRSKGELGKSGKFSVLKIQQYFNDRKGRLPKLQRELIRSAGGNGKYYLQTGADLTQYVSPGCVCE